MKSIFFAHGTSNPKATAIASALHEKCLVAGFAVTSTHDPETEVMKNDVSNVFERIKESTLVVTMVSPQHWGVLLELGYALGIGKPVFLIADMSSELPFDLSAIRAIDAQLPTYEIVSTIMKVLEAITAKEQDARQDAPVTLQDMLSLRRDYPERFEQIPYLVFEKAVIEAFKRTGYAVVESTQGADYGFDFRISKASTHMLVEVKKSSVSTKVSIASVQQLLGALHAYGASRGLLVCTSEFTDSARTFAKRYAKELTLWTAEDLEQFLLGKRET